MCVHGRRERGREDGGMKKVKINERHQPRCSALVRLAFPKITSQ